MAPVMHTIPPSLNGVRAVLLVLAAAGTGPVPSNAERRLALSVDVTPHVRSEVMQYRRGPAPGVAALVRLHLLNAGDEPVPLGPESRITVGGRTPAELLEAGEWAWHDFPDVWPEGGASLAPGEAALLTFNGRVDAWGPGSRHDLLIEDPSGTAILAEPVEIAAPASWLSAVTFLGDRASVVPDRMIVHVRNGSGSTLAVEEVRLRTAPIGDGGRVFPRRGAWSPGDGAVECLPGDGSVAAGDAACFIVRTGALPLTYGIVEVAGRTADGAPVLASARLRIRRESFDLSGGWVSTDFGGRNSLHCEPYLKTLRRMHLDTAHIGDVPGYTDSLGPEGLYTRYPLKLFNKLQPFERFDTDEMLPRIHAVEFLGEPQYGGGRPVPPMEVWRELAPYRVTRLPTSVTHSEERIWRFYAGLSDFPHYDAYRITAPAADSWARYSERWGGLEIRWGAPLETIGELTRSLRDLNRPAAIAYWSQGAHAGWGRSGGRERASPTPDELRQQAYHALASRITSLYWFNLSLESLLKFPDLIPAITQVGRECRLLEPFLLEGDAFHWQATQGDDGRPDWDLSVVAGPRGAALFALDLAYRPDPESRTFRFGEPRPATFRFPLPAYLDGIRSVVRVDADGIKDVAFRRTGDGAAIEVEDRVSRAGIYLAVSGADRVAAFRARWDELRAFEESFDFDPGASAADLEVLRALEAGAE